MFTQGQESTIWVRDLYLLISNYLLPVARGSRDLRESKTSPLTRAWFREGGGPQPPV